MSIPRINRRCTGPCGKIRNQGRILNGTFWCSECLQERERHLAQVKPTTGEQPHTSDRVSGPTFRTEPITDTSTEPVTEPSTEPSTDRTTTPQTGGAADINPPSDTAMSKTNGQSAQPTLPVLSENDLLGGQPPDLIELLLNYGPEDWSQLGAVIDDRIAELEGEIFRLRRLKTIAQQGGALKEGATRAVNDKSREAIYRLADEGTDPEAIAQQLELTTRQVKSVLAKRQSKQARQQATAASMTGNGALAAVTHV